MRSFTRGPKFQDEKHSTRGQWIVSVDGERGNIQHNAWTGQIELVNDDERKLDEFTGIDYRSIKGYGVVFEDKRRDLKHLVDNFTAPALAAALRDREETLHICSTLLEEGREEELRKVLRPFHTTKISERRRKRRKMFLHDGFQSEHVYMIRKYLHRLPRQLPRYAEKRASVMLPLCNSQGVACVLFQYRSDNVRSHKSQVCFPGGIVDNRKDSNIVETCLRELEEEMGISQVRDVCGVLRLDWGTILKLVGVSVTPVVAWMGDIEDYDFSNLNRDEVQAAFTIPVEKLLNKKNWSTSEIDGVPSLEFNGGPYPVWGLTAFILYRFLQDVLKRYRVFFDHEVEQLPSDEEVMSALNRHQSRDSLDAQKGGKCIGGDD